MHRSFVVLLTPTVLTVACCYAAADTSERPAIEADVVYGHKDGLAMTLDVIRPTSESNERAILFMVSGGWFSRWSPPEDLRDWLRPYVDHGYTLILVRHGSSPRYPLPEIVADVRQAVRFVRLNADRWEIDADRLGVLGMSAGGHLALMLGTTGDDGDAEAETPLEQTASRVSAVVALVPPTDLRTAVWEAPETLPVYRNFPALDLSVEEGARYSPVVHASPDDAPALVIMGGDDELVPPKHGKWIAEALAKEEVPHQLTIIPDVGHGLGGVAKQQQITQQALAWFDNYLLGAAQRSVNSGK